VDNAATPFGTSWRVLRTATPVTPSSTYAYPNPFSPDDEPVRIRYATGGSTGAVTIEVFDFGMNRVRSVLRDAPRAANAQFDELWDGKDDGGNRIANGVYFYRVTIDDGEPAWGKIMVLQ
jgi:hypothetical protein